MLYYAILKIDLDDKKNKIFPDKDTYNLYKQVINIQ